MSLNIQEIKRRKAVSTAITVDQNPLNDDHIPWYHRDIEIGTKGLKSKDKEALYSELAVLLNAGLDIQSSLELIEDNFRKKSKKLIIQKIRNFIIEGSAFSEAIKSVGNFSNYEIYSIQIGEETGQLLQVLNQLSDYYAKNRKYKQLLTSAMAYPSFVIGFALLVTFFLLKYLVPLFSDVYKKFDGELPMITQKIISLSDWTSKYGLYVFLGFGLVGFIIYKVRKKVWVRSTGAKILLNIPVIGPVFHLIYLSRFCQSMHLLLRAKVPILKAVNLVKLMVDFYPIEKSLAFTQQQILQGSPLNKALSKFSFYPKQFIALIKVGEESSTVDNMFEKLAAQYSETAEQKTAMIGSLLEPILIICLGALVAIVLVAMYMPLFQMTVGIN